jgi:MFS family permease
MSLFKKIREKTDWTAVAPSILLLANSFAWYIFAYTIFSQIVNGLTSGYNEKLGLYLAYYIMLAIAAAFGYKLFSKSRKNALSTWVFTGAVSTLLLTAFSNSNLFIDFILAAFLGASVGIGLPSCLSYFSDSTSVENRGFTGGITWSIVGFCVLGFAFIFNSVDQFWAIIGLTLWRLIGGIIFIANKRRQADPVSGKSPRFSEVFHTKGLLLFWIPWVMFAIINFAEAPILEKVFGENLFAFVQITEWVLIGIFALVGGLAADIFGRKRVVIVGFVMLGVEYAAMSILPQSSLNLAAYLFMTLDGITWGLLFSVFFTALWGDLGESHAKEKFYIIGGLPYLLANFMYIAIKPYASTIQSTTTFTFASFFLFISVIPLMYAPETLPERVMKDRDLKSYLEKAKKIVEKEERSEKPFPDKTKEKAREDEEESEEPSEDEEARKLAEKYY